jgi:hypothetical protein
MELRVWKCDSGECPQEVKTSIRDTDPPLGWWVVEGPPAVMQKATGRGGRLTFCSLACLKTFAEKNQ